MLLFLSLQSPVFDPRSVHVGFLVDYITEVQVLLLLLRSTAVSVVPVALCTTFLSFEYHRLYVMLPVGDIIKYVPISLSLSLFPSCLRLQVLVCAA